PQLPSLDPHLASLDPQLPELDPRLPRLDLHHPRLDTRLPRLSTRLARTSRAGERALRAATHSYRAQRHAAARRGDRYKPCIGGLGSLGHPNLRWVAGCPRLTHVGYTCSDRSGDGPAALVGRSYLEGQSHGETDDRAKGGACSQVADGAAQPARG